jgi:hypothetical protein
VVVVDVVNVGSVINEICPALKETARMNSRFRSASARGACTTSTRVVLFLAAAAFFSSYSAFAEDGGAAFTDKSFIALQQPLCRTL